jgi:hypothetical protein
MEKALSIMFSEWFHIPIMFTFLCMVLSPSRFFKFFEETIMREPEREVHVQYNSELEAERKKETLTELHRDEMILQNLNKMIVSAPNHHSRQLWEHKLLEFKRSQRWKRLEYYPYV